MIPSLVSGALRGNPVLLQYTPGVHVLPFGDDASHEVTLRVRGVYPKESDLKVVITSTTSERFTLALRVPIWAEGCRAHIDGEDISIPETRLIEIDRAWQPGDIIHIHIPLDIRVVSHTDITSDAVAFVRGPQVLATDTAVDGHLPNDNWWGDDLHVHTATQGGQEQLFELVPFADAGQNKEAYTVLHDGIERSEP